MIQVSQNVDFSPKLIYIFDGGTQHLLDGHCFLAIVATLSTENSTKGTSSQLIFFRPNKMVVYSSWPTMGDWDGSPSLSPCD